jgi:aspartate-semialdehyde dehydrogenase
MTKPKNLRFAVVGSDTLRGREIRSVLAARKVALRSLEFFDPDVEHEYSKLTQFGDEPKVVHHLGPDSLDGLDMVFLAADRETNAAWGRRASKRDFRAIDLCETFNTSEDVPVVVAGVNDAIVRGGKRFPLIANPHPVTIVLSRILHALGRKLGVERAVSVVLQPASAFEEEGIQELIDQSFALLGGSSLPVKTFGGQVAFNLLPQTEKPGRDGFSPLEKQILSEIRRVLDNPAFPVSLSVVLVPVFHTYSIMTYLELVETAGIAELQALFRKAFSFELTSPGKSHIVSSAASAGKNTITVGQIKKDPAAANGFWIWTTADNLTLGSAENAYEIVRGLFKVD